MRLQLAIAQFDPSLTPALNSIPVLLQPHNLGVVYKSAIAIRLASNYQETLTKIVTWLKTKLSDTYSDFSITVMPPGWLYLHWNDSAIAKWLQSWIDLPIDLGLARLIPPKTLNLFPLQYVHARCCSMLGLAVEAGWLQVVEGNFIFSQPIPWWDELGTWHLSGFDAARAIASLTNLTDNLLDSLPLDPIDCQKLAMKLAECFWSFERKLQIYGANNDEKQCITHCKLGLVAAVKNCLRLILQELFQTVALTEL